MLGRSKERLVIVSADSHAAIPADEWSNYVEPTYQHLLPSLHDENAEYLPAMSVISEYSPALMAVLDDEGIMQAGGRRGASYRDWRIQEMDREGVAAEIVFYHDASCVGLWMSQSNEWKPEDVRAAGRRAYHRWAAERMIDDEGRLLMLGDVGSCTEMDETLSEMKWLKEHGFFGVHMPGTLGDPDMPPLHDAYFEPFWSACEDMGLVVGLHAGFGLEQGSVRPIIRELAKSAKNPGSALSSLTNSDKSFFVRDMKPRRALFQVMLGGVFDRHPRLKVMITELRADWVPGTMASLDAWVEANEVPAQQKPSEYWQQYCVAGMSFMKPSEVEIRHEIGIERLMFGRDYPHAEGTWPKTWLHLKALLSDVPEEEVRMLLGGNAISFFELDQAHLAAIAEHIQAPTPADIFNEGEVAQRYIDAFGERSGFLKPAEVVDPVEIAELVAADFGTT
jgi:predicted TIM-barrel fold metal-dependent hydrolase